MALRMSAKSVPCERLMVLLETDKASPQLRTDEKGYMTFERPNELASPDGQILLLDDEIVLFWTVCSSGHAWRHHPTDCP
jgi:hypothetical protein